MRNPRLLIFVGLGLVGLLSACNEPDARIAAQLAAGEQAYRNKQYPSAVRSLSAVADQSKNAKQVGRALYVRGMVRAATNDRLKAYSDLGRAAEIGGPDIAWRARSVLGVMQFEDQSWSGAARTLQAAIDDAPDAPPKDALLYRLGLCRERCGAWNDALDAFAQIARKFPSGVYAPLAKRRLTLRPTNFAVQCGVFAQPASADRMIADLRRSGFEAYARREERGGQTIRVVLVGRFNRYDDAIQMLRRAKAYVNEAVLWP